MGCLLAFGGFILFLLIMYCFSIHFLLGIIVSIAIIAIIIAITQKQEKAIEKEISKRKNTLKELTKRLKGIKRSQSVMTDNYTKRIIFDSENQMLGTVDANKNLAKKYRFEQIIEVSLLENGNSITTTSRKSQLGGALVGGLVAGGVGAVIGGLSGEKKSVEKLESIQLKIIVDDNINPVHIFQFNEDVIERNSEEYKKIMVRVNHWHALLVKTMKQNEEKKIEPKVSKTVKDDTTSISKELKELFELKKEGILTEEEFNKQKEKILNKS